jgi:hypothetical protein
VGTTSINRRRVFCRSFSKEAREEIKQLIKDREVMSFTANHLRISTKMEESILLSTSS